MATTATTISIRYSSEDDDDVILFRRLEDPCFVSRIRERARARRSEASQRRKCTDPSIQVTGRQRASTTLLKKLLASICITTTPSVDAVLFSSSCDADHP